MKSNSLGEQLAAHEINSEIAKIMREERKEQARLIEERDTARELVLEKQETIDSLMVKIIKLKEVAEEVLLWASTSQEHGGNPYLKKFVQLAQEALK